MSTDTEYLSAPEYAELMGVHQNTAWRWLLAGMVEGAFKTPGGHWRVPDPRQTPDPLDVIVEEA